MTIDIDKLTIGEAQKIAKMVACFGQGADATEAVQTTQLGCRKSAYEIGKQYMFRTVTHIITGQLVEIYPDGLVVAHAAWIADTGRYMQAVATGDFKVVEPYPANTPVIVNFTAMIDAVEIPKLPLTQK